MAWATRCKIAERSWAAKLRILSLPYWAASKAAWASSVVASGMRSITPYENSLMPKFPKVKIEKINNR
jgi:hypothetical protein